MGATKVVQLGSKLYRWASDWPRGAPGNAILVGDGDTTAAAGSVEADGWFVYACASGPIARAIANQDSDAIEAPGGQTR